MHRTCEWILTNTYFELQIVSKLIIFCIFLYNMLILDVENIYFVCDTINIYELLQRDTF